MSETHAQSVRVEVSASMSSVASLKLVRPTYSVYMYMYPNYQFVLHVNAADAIKSHLEWDGVRHGKVSVS